jgi:hypothetical protein
MKFFKKILLWGTLAGILLFLLSYHIIYIDGTLRLLRKSELTLEYTFYSAQGKESRSILRIDQLRHDGIGDVLVEMGRLSEEQMVYLEAKYDAPETD